MRISTEDSIETDGNVAKQHSSFRQDYYQKSLNVIDSQTIGLPSVKNRAKQANIVKGLNTSTTIELLGSQERHNQSKITAIDSSAQ